MCTPEFCLGLSFKVQVGKWSIEQAFCSNNMNMLTELHKVEHNTKLKPVRGNSWVWRLDRIGLA